MSPLLSTVIVWRELAGRQQRGLWPCTKSQRCITMRTATKFTLATQTACCMCGQTEVDVPRAVSWPWCMVQFQFQLKSKGTYNTCHPDLFPMSRSPALSSSSQDQSSKKKTKIKKKRGSLCWVLLLFRFRIRHSKKHTLIVNWK